MGWHHRRSLSNTKGKATVEKDLRSVVAYMADAIRACRDLLGIMSRQTNLAEISAALERLRAARLKITELLEWEGEDEPLAVQVYFDVYDHRRGHNAAAFSRCLTADNTFKVIATLLDDLVQRLEGTVDQPWRQAIDVVIPIAFDLRLSPTTGVTEERFLEEARTAYIDSGGTGDPDRFVRLVQSFQLVELVEIIEVVCLSVEEGRLPQDQMTEQFGETPSCCRQVDGTICSLAEL